MGFISGLWCGVCKCLVLYNIHNFTSKAVCFETVLKLLTRIDEPYILRLGSVQSEDQGWYSCIAANSLGETVASSYLTILNTKEVNNEFNNPSLEEDNKLSVTVSSLEFNLLNLEQSDNDESADHDLDVKTNDGEEEKPPLFKNLNKLVDHMHKPSGSSIQLVCPATGHPTPNITWTRNNTEIERHIGKVTYKKWSIQMDDAITKDSGIYKCTVCNALGCIEHSTKVTVSDRLRSRPIISDFGMVLVNAWCCITSTILHPAQYVLGHFLIGNNTYF